MTCLPRCRARVQLKVRGNRHGIELQERREQFHDVNYNAPHVIGVVLPETFEMPTKPRQNCRQKVKDLTGLEP